MQRIILILLVALSLNSCFKEDRSGCPADMRFTFNFVDKYAPSDDYDSRIANDALFCIFRDNILVYKQVISYQDIKNGKEYILRKTSEISGNLELIAWAVPKGSVVNDFPNINIGDQYQNVKMSLRPDSRDTQYYEPIKNVSYMCTLAFNEPIDQPSTHSLDLINSYCRVEVNITDASQTLTEGNSGVVVKGTMSSMDLNMNGIGQQASVDVFLACPSHDGMIFTTNQFGVYPSAEGQFVSIDIIKNLNIPYAPVYKTLTVPRDLMPMGAKAGDLLIFDYMMDADEFYITIDGFKQKVVITDM